MEKIDILTFVAQYFEAEENLEKFPKDKDFIESKEQAKQALLKEIKRELQY